MLDMLGISTGEELLNVLGSFIAVGASMGAVAYGFFGYRKKEANKDKDYVPVPTVISELIALKQKLEKLDRRLDQVDLKQTTSALTINEISKDLDVVLSEIQILRALEEREASKK